MTDEQRIHRSTRAQEILGNEEFDAAFRLIEEELTTAWKSSPQRDAEGREKLFLALTMLGKVRLALEDTVNTGKIARVNLMHDNPTMREQAREFLGMNTSR
jgi:hypothetical protein